MASVTKDLDGVACAPCGSPPVVQANGNRRKRLMAALFALGILVGTIAVLAGLFMLVAQRQAPDAYPGLNGFPKTGQVPNKTDGDVVTFVFAFLVGFLIQRSRWCNASAVRDAVLFRSFRNTKPLLMGMMVITGMFTVFESIHVGTPISIVGGAFTVLGLFLFGIGMVLGGACTVSVWIRSAEGSIGALWALVYTFVGMFLFSELWNVMRWPAANYLQTASPKLSILSFGSFNAMTIRSYFGHTWGPVAVLVAGGLQVAVLAFIYRRLLRIERHADAATAGPSRAVPESRLLAVEEMLTPVDTADMATAKAEAQAEAGAQSSVAASAGAHSERTFALGGAGASLDAAGGIGAIAADSSAPWIDLPEWGHVSISKVVDCSGEMCPRPQLLAKRAVVKEMSVGDVLELVVDNPSSPELVPTIMGDIGAIHLGTQRDAVAWHLYIRKERETATTARGGRRR